MRLPAKLGIDHLSKVSTRNNGNYSQQWKEFPVVFSISTEIDCQRRSRNDYQ